MARFPRNDIISLIGQIPRYDLGESVGPDLRLGDVLDASAQRKLGKVALGYRTAQGDPRLRQLIADAHGVSPDDVVVTVGGMHALFLIAFVLCDRGDEAVTVSPMFPLARNTRAAVGAEHSNRFAVVRSRLPVRPRRHRSTPLGVRILRASPVPGRFVQDIVTLMGERCPEAHLFMDETYRKAVYGDDAVTPSAVALSQRVISCASLSKCHGAPGLRLGWAITRDAALKEQLVVGNSTP